MPAVENRSDERLKDASARDGLRFRILEQSEIDWRAVARWRDLARRSCHQNPFLLPDFVLPAWKYLTPEQQHVLAVVESSSDQRWLAAGGFSLGQTTSEFPLPHALASTNAYTFRTGLLLDSESANDALDTLLDGITEGGWRFQGLEFPGLRLDSILARALIASTERLGFDWHTTHQRMVPAVFPDIITEEYLARHWSKSRRKSIRRSRNRLEAHGPVELRLSRQPNDVARALELFLKLEHASWKGQEGTACKSQPQDEAFIREAIRGLAQHGNVVMSELIAGDCIAAAAINLTASTALYAFKIGWDIELAEASPGVVHETELLLESQKRLNEFTIFDSCATESSYIAPLWPERIPVATGVICASRLSRWSQRLLNAGRKAKLAISWW